MALVKLQNKHDFDSVITSHSKVMLLKNSTTCPISRQAFNEYQRFSNEAGEDVYYLNVQESRDLSHWIATTYGIKHESPQVLLFKNNEVSWNDSHFNITMASLKEHQ